MVEKFKDTLDDDLNNTFFNTDEFADNATYTPTGGSPFPFTVKVIFDDEFQNVQADTDVPVISRQPVARVIEDVFLTALGREPLDGDRISIKSKNYSVVNYQPDGVGTVNLILHEV